MNISDTGSWRQLRVLPFALISPSQTECKDTTGRMYQKIVSKGHLDYSYLHIRLDFEDGASGGDIDVVLFKHILVEAITSLFGQVGASNRVDVLKYNEEDHSAILRVHSQFVVKLWSSLSLYGQYGGQHCAFRVIQVSSHLMALAANSRTMVLHLAKE